MTTRMEDIPAIVDELIERHERSVTNLRHAIAAYLSDHTLPDAEARGRGHFAYPELRVDYEAEGAHPRITRAFARLNQSGSYATSITRPRMFRRYLEDQLTLLVRDYKVRVSVGLSDQEIPYPYVLDGSDELSLDGAVPADLARWFPSVRLADIGDEIADGLVALADDPTRAAGAVRRPAHRLLAGAARRTTPARRPSTCSPTSCSPTTTATSTSSSRWALRSSCKEPDSPYEALSAAGDVLVTRDTPDPERAVADGAWRKHQMPAYHLMAEAGAGITLVNIGVGPSNAKTITDHLAVLRPRGLADDRPLRRPARHARPSATMCWPTPICATTTCWTTCCRRRSRSRRSPRCSWR